MFDIMMPNHAGKLPISKMNLSSIGSKMIQALLKQKNVDILSIIIEQGQKMGVKEEIIIEGVDYGDVATCIGDTIDANLNLSI